MSNDTEFLKKRISQASLSNLSGAEQLTPDMKRAYAQSMQQSPTLVDSTDTFLEEVTADSPDVSIRQKKLHKRAEAASANDPEKSARIEEEQQQQEVQEELDKQDVSQVEAARSVATRTLSATSEHLSPLADRIASLPVYGGIGFLLLILVILLFTVVQVNAQGDTRLKQLWYMLNGRATIKGRQTVQQVIPGTGDTIIPGGGVSGNFGSTTSTTGSGASGNFGPTTSGPVGSSLGGQAAGASTFGTRSTTPGLGF